jgi:hypothetical protein
MTSQFIDDGPLTPVAPNAATNIKAGPPDMPGIDDIPDVDPGPTPEID